MKTVALDNWFQQNCPEYVSEKDDLLLVLNRKGDFGAYQLSKEGSFEVLKGPESMSLLASDDEREALISKVREVDCSPD